MDIVDKIVEMSDPDTRAHQERVAILAASITRHLGLVDRVTTVQVIGRLHDIGKTKVPPEILNKPDKLEPHEFAIVQGHPLMGYEILGGFEIPEFVRQCVLQHHERVDGTGYPYRLQPEQIFVESRIVAVADFVDALNSDRPYRPAMGIDDTLKEAVRVRGSHLDITVVEACLRVFSSGVATNQQWL